MHIIIGDFNSQHTNWGYKETDNNEHQVKMWAESNKLTLIHDPKLPHCSTVVNGKKTIIPVLYS